MTTTQHTAPMAVGPNGRILGAVRVSRYACPFCKSVLGSALDSLPSNCPNCAASTLNAFQELVPLEEPAQPAAEEPTPTYNASYSGGMDMGEKIRVMFPYTLGMAVIMAPSLIGQMDPGLANNPLLGILSAWDFMGGGSSSAPPGIPPILPMTFTWMKTVILLVLFFKAFEVFAD